MNLERTQHEVNSRRHSTLLRCISSPPQGSIWSADYEALPRIAHVPVALLLPFDERRTRGRNNPCSVASSLLMCMCVLQKEPCKGFKKTNSAIKCRVFYIAGESLTSSAMVSREPYCPPPRSDVHCEVESVPHSSISFIRNIKWLAKEGQN